MGSAIRRDYCPLAQKVEQDWSKPGFWAWQLRTPTLGTDTWEVEPSNCPIITYMLQLQGYKPQWCAFRDHWGYGFGCWGPRAVQYAYKYQQAMNAHSAVASCHLHLNCFSSSSSPCQHICSFCNLYTPRREVNDSGILTNSSNVSVVSTGLLCNYSNHCV